FFTVGEVVMMLTLALADRGGVAALAAVLVGARDVLFWLLLGGFVWVVGDLFQQYAAKYVGISRGIPLANTNQLWGGVWGLLGFGMVARVPHMTLGWGWVAGLTAAMLALLAGTGRLLWSTTRFN